MTCRSLSMAGAFLLAACGSPGPDLSTEVRRTIEANNANAEKWYASGDVDSLVSLFAEDVWQMPPNHLPLTGRKAVREFWSGAFKMGQWQFDLNVEDVAVSGRLAVERGKYRVGFVAAPGAPPGMESFVDQGNYVVFWRKEADGVWRAVWDAPVSELPMAKEQK